MKMKKLLASALAAAMVVSSMIGTMVTSAATTVGTITAGTVNAVVGETDTITADINIAFPDGVVAPHNIISVALEGYNLSDVALGTVTYADGSAAGVVSIDADGSNLAAGKILLEAPVDSKAPTVTAIALTATFVDADDVDTVAGTYAIVVNGDDMTDVNEAEIAISAVNGALVVAAPHVCTAGAATANGDGTHDIACAGCDKLFADNVACTYVDGVCSVCGYAEPVTGPVLDENILIRDPDVTIDATLFIRLRVDKRTLPAGTASYEMVVIPTKYDVANSNNYYNEIIAEEIALTLDSETSNYAIYYYKDAAMYELGLNVDAYVKCYDANGNYIYYSNKTSYTPSVGLTALCNATNTVVETKKVVTDLLNMGAAAQEYIASLAAAKDSDAYNTVQAGNLVNAGLATQDYAGKLGTVDTTNTTVKNPNATYKETVKPAFSLGVAPTPSLQVYKAKGLQDNFTLEVSYTSNRDAQKVSYEITGDQWGLSGTKLVYYASGVAYYDGNAVLTMKLYHNGVEVSTTTYTVEAGLSALFADSNPKLVAFAQATAIFGATARARL